MHKIIHRLLIIFIAATAIVTAGCSGNQASKEQPVYVRTQTISTGGVDSSDSYPGQVKSKYENNLSFQVGGRIVKRYVNAGDYVKKGQPIMALDTNDLRQNVAKADEQARSAQAQLTLASSNLRRYKELYAQEAISAATLDTYQTNYAAAAAAYKQAQAQVGLANNALDYGTLTANSDGIITAVSGETGQVVSAGQTVAQLAQSDGLDVVVNIPENKIASFKVGEKAELSFWALPDVTAKGTIWTISPAADPNTRTYQVRIAMPEVPAGVQLGMTASAVFVQAGGDEKAEAVVPLSAFYQTGAEPQLWVVKDNAVHLQAVKVKSFSKNSAVVSDLAQGTVIVTAGADKLYEGEKVQPAAGGAL